MDDEIEFSVEGAQRIPCTQFLRPDGRKRTVYTYRQEDSDVFKKAMLILEAGYTFACEQLSTGVIAQYICDDVNQVDMDLRLSNNGPQVNEMFDKMVMEFTIPDKGGEDAT